VSVSVFGIVLCDSHSQSHASCFVGGSDLTLDPMDLISQPTALELMFRWWSPS